MNKRIVFPLLALCILGGAIPLTISLISPPALMITGASLPGRACTAFCLDNGDGCVFGANQDNSLEMGMVFVNKRNVLKTNWDPGTSWRVRLGFWHTCSTGGRDTSLRQAGWQSSK